MIKCLFIITDKKLKIAHFVFQNCTFRFRDYNLGTFVSDTDEIEQMAWELLSALAGYCYADDYDQWFEGENAELI